MTVSIILQPMYTAHVMNERSKIVLNNIYSADCCDGVTV